MPDTRSRAACNGCRSRKQKCDEKKPECSRCRQLGSKCTWSKTRKRGPAKGYAEALERRLEETEIAFLRLLLASQSQTRAQAFQDDTLELAQSFRAGFYSRVTANRPSGGSEHLKSAIMNQWEKLPLKTSSDIEQWTGTMTSSPSSIEASSMEVDPEITPSPGSGQLHDTPSDQAIQNISSGCGEVDTRLITTHQALSDIEGQPPERRQLRHGSSTTIANQSSSSAKASQGIPTPNCMVDLPEDFKSQFLW